MKISIEILSRYLKKHFKFKENCTLSNELILERPVFFKSTLHSTHNKVYIVYENNFKNTNDISKNSLIINIGSIKDKSLLDLYNVFEFDKSTSPFDLFNKIQDIFDIYDNWENQLQQILNDTTSLKDMLDASFEVFNNPLRIFSADFNLVAYSSIIDTVPSLKYLSNNELVYKNSTSLKLDPTFNHYRNSKEAFIYSSNYSNIDMLCINIFDHEKFVYRVVVCNNIHKFYDTDINLLNYFSKYLNLMLNKLYSVDPDMSYTLENIICNVLSEKIANPNFIKQMFNEFYWFSTHTYFCINIKIGSLDIQNLTINSICKQIECIIPHSCSFFYNNDIAVFVNLTNFKGSVYDVMHKLSILFRDNYLKAGISNTFVGLSQLKYNYLQACIALSTGRRYKPDLWIYYFEYIAPFYLIECCTNELPLDLVCSKKILTLIEHDNKHDTEYYDTLRVYLMNNLNAVKSSKDLFIHRSTFLYRINKIKELVHIKFDNPKALLYYSMSFSILETAKIDSNI